MLAIRLQRVGRKGLPQYRMIVQESQLSPKSGRVVKYLGSYNPHTKEVKIDVESAKKFLKNGAQPSERTARILKSEGVKLPSWVNISDPKERKTKNPEKLRKNQPEQAEEKSAETPAPEAKDQEKPAAEEASTDEANAEPTEIAQEAEENVEEDKKDNETDTQKA